MKRASRYVSQFWRARRGGTLLVLALFFSLLLSIKAADPTPPNILFAIADDWGRHAGVYGTSWVKTPAFDRVAREGLLFSKAYTPNPKCAPSRASILTGRNPWQLKAAANHIPYFPPEFKTWPEALADNGWFVGFTQKGWGPGVATNAQGQSRLMTGRPFNARKTPAPTPAMSNNDYATNFRDFLDAAAKDQPWAFWFGASEPHRNYKTRSGADQGGKQLDHIQAVPAYWPDDPIVRHDMLDYALEVEHFDQHLATMLDELDRRGLLDNTIVIVTSDNGMPFPRVKGQLYEDASHMPLAVRWPKGIRATGVINDFVSFIDFAPTILELAGLTWRGTGMAEPSGRTLVPIFKSAKTGRVDIARDHVLLGRERQDVGRPEDAGYPVRGIVTDRFLYLHNFEPKRWPSGNPETGYLDTDGSPVKKLILERRRTTGSDRFWDLCFGKRPAEELYDLQTDPGCVTNLATRLPSETQKLREKMLAELRAQNDPRALGQGDTFDQYPHANPAHRNFHHRFLQGEKLPTGWVNPSDYEPTPPNNRKN